jgi:membrane protease YdiL (CAAX protease family)
MAVEKLNIKLSPHIQATKIAKRPTGWALASILVIVVSIIAVGSGASALFAQIFGTPGEGTIKSQLSEVAMFGATTLVIYLWVKFKEQRPFKTVGFLGDKGLKRYGVGFLIGAVMMVVPTIILLLTGQYEQAVKVGSTTGSGAAFVVMGLFFVWAVQSTGEEIAMRGYLLQSYGRKLPSWVAVLVPSLLFSVLHIGANPIALLNILLVAIFFSFLSLGQGSIWLAAGIHTGWNMTQGNILGIPVSGLSREVSIWVFQPVSGAPTWLTGGSYGIESSILATIILGAASIWSYRYYQSKQLVWEAK